MSLNVCNACARRVKGRKKRGKKAISERVVYRTACIITLAPLDVSPSISNRAIYTHTHTHTHTLKYVYKCIRAAHGGKNEIKHETHNPSFTTTTTPPRLQPCTYIICKQAVIYYIKYIRPESSSSPCVRTATAFPCIQPYNIVHSILSRLKYPPDRNCSHGRARGPSDVTGSTAAFLPADEHKNSFPRDEPVP